jgi:hypothetical protein
LSVKFELFLNLLEFFWHKFPIGNNILHISVHRFNIMLNNFVERIVDTLLAAFDSVLIDETGHT